MGFFKRGTDKLEAMKNKYAKAETNISRIVDVLEKHQIQLMKDAATMDKMYALNLNYFKELSMYILAGKKKLEEIRSTELPKLVTKAQTTNLPEDAQVVMILLGVTLITEGVLNLITILTAVKIIRHQLPEVIDAEYCQIDPNRKDM